MTFRTAPLLIALFFSLQVSGQCEYTEISLASSTGDWGDEMSWELYQGTESDTILIASFQGMYDDQSSSQTLCLEDGCYVLLALDSWGDGWNGGTISTDINLDGFEEPFSLEQGGYGFLPFTVGEVECDFQLPGCTDPEAVNYIQGTTLDDGSCTYLESFIFSDDNGSVTREYIYYAPEGLEAGAPLIFVLHGYTGGAVGISGFSGFRELADEEGFAVVFPQGLEDDSGYNHWNANFTFSSVNDTGFLVALAEHLQATYEHAPECTYSCGYSNGGYMSYTLACDAASTFRGIGSVGGTMSAHDWNNCTPSQAVPVVHLHGTDDNSVPYEGSPNWNFGWGEQPGVETIVSTWADWNNCTEVSETALPNLNTTDGSTVDLFEHTGGDSGYRALLYRVNDGGHNWFGSWGNMDIVSAVEMWNFWSSFCGSTSSIASAEALQAKIFSWKNAEITAEQACHIAVYDALGRKVLDRPLMAGQTLRINKAQLHLIVARNLKGQFQQEKVWLD